MNYNSQIAETGFFFRLILLLLFIRALRSQTQTHITFFADAQRVPVFKHATAYIQHTDLYHNMYQLPVYLWSRLFKR